MSQSSSARFPAITLAWAIAALLVGSAAWFTIVSAATGPVTHAAVISGLFILAIAFLPLGRLASWRPWAPVRIALGIAVVLSILDAMSMPAPPRQESVSSFIAFFVIVVLCVTAHLLAEPRPRVAFLALGILAAIGLYFGYAIDSYATSPRFGAQAKYNAWPVAVIGAACLAACWYGRAMLRRSSRQQS